MQSVVVVSALAAAFALSGCTVDDGPPEGVVVGDGVLDVDWTIDDAKDSHECVSQDADGIDVVVTTLAGNVIGDFPGNCRDFVISLELAPGSYFGDATLLDANGQARTTPVDLGRFEIYGDDELDVPIDFPLDSFY